MRYLFKDWERIEENARASARILLLADYDGTLASIVSRPKDAALDGALRELLGALSKKKRFHIGIISGRRLRDVKRLVGLNNIYYAGNHGLEIKGPNVNFTHPSCRRFQPYLRRIKERLLLKVRHIKGAIVEYKGGSLSLHYRLVRRDDIEKLRKIFNKACAPYLKSGRIEISRGKKIWEVRLPLRWNKGNAALMILKSVGMSGTLPIYLGDDLTDEDAFSALRKKRGAVTVSVGEKKGGGAKYFLRSPAEVRKFLVRLCRI